MKTDSEIITLYEKLYEEERKKSIRPKVIDDNIAIRLWRMAEENANIEAQDTFQAQYIVKAIQEEEMIAPDFLLKIVAEARASALKSCLLETDQTECKGVGEVCLVCHAKAIHRAKKPARSEEFVKYLEELKHNLKTLPERQPRFGGKISISQEQSVLEGISTMYDKTHEVAAAEGDVCEVCKELKGEYLQIRDKKQLCLRCICNFMKATEKKGNPNLDGGICSQDICDCRDCGGTFRKKKAKKTWRDKIGEEEDCKY